MGLRTVHLYVGQNEQVWTMSSFFYLSLGIVQRSRGGSVVQRSAYQARRSTTLANGTYVDYSDRGGHIATRMFAPPGSPAWATDPQEFWRRAAAAEKRADAQEARLLEIALPRGLSRADWIDIASRLARVFAGKGMVVQADVHCTTAGDGGEHPHAHFMLSMRELKDDRFADKKARHWNKLFVGKASVLRKEMADFLNAYCKLKGVAYEADPRSNAERGLPPPEPCIPRWNFLFHKRTGKKTSWLKHRDREREARAAIVAIEKECVELERKLAAARSQDAAASNFDLMIEAESFDAGFAARQPARQSSLPTR
jgi:MobA/MobL family